MKNSSSFTNEEMKSETGDGDDYVDYGGPLIKINVSYGPAHYEVHVPAQSTFGYMKIVLEPKVGLVPKKQRIFFRGREVGNDEYLHESGVKDRSKLLLLEHLVRKEKKLEEIQENEGTSKVETKGSEEITNVELKGGEEMSKAFQAIAEVRAEVDKHAERVATLEAAVNSGTKVLEEEFVVSSELLMRQLLKLDAIQAEGEAKLQRKAEVGRVQNFHEMLDNLKAINSKPFSSNRNAVSVTTEWETFDSGVETMTPSQTSSSTRITDDWERFD